MGKKCKRSTDTRRSKAKRETARNRKSPQFVEKTSIVKKAKNVETKVANKKASFAETKKATTLRTAIRTNK